MADDTRIDVYLICNAKFHDTNFARLELLTLLESRYTDRSVGYVRESLGNDEPQPQLYLHPYGQGQVRKGGAVPIGLG